MNEMLEGFLRALQLIFSLNPEILNISALSLRVSGLAVILGSLVGIPTGTALGLMQFIGKRSLIRISNVLMRTTINAFMGLPPVFVGLVIYLLLSTSGPFGPLHLLYTPTAMLIVQLILTIPVVTGITISAVDGVGEEVRDRALSLGATSWQLASTIVREARGGILTAIVASFGAAISEVGGIMIVGGNIRWFTRALTTAIMYETALGEFEMALALGIILLMLAFIVNLSLAFLQLRGVRR